ncbi:MAG: haloalkane dehalogenase [Alphaproteobacteria bacterium]|nr:haloalkane dehalogenase [Alphaproteobacteria bacterium]
MISAEDRYPRQRATVDGRSMAYVDVGAGRSVVLLHGNPTSSYLWRNIIPHIEPVARCIAPDLIGMGDSDKLPSTDDEAYKYAIHRDYLDGLLEQLDLGTGIIMVGQDWGSVLAFDWARRHAVRMDGIVHFEAIITPFTWEDFPENPEDDDSARAWFEGLRSPEGERMILEDNMFVETRIPTRTLREVTEEEMDVYRRPYLNPGEDRRPTLTWARNLPISGEPTDVVETVEANAKWLQETEIAKVFIRGEPGGLIQGPRIDFCRSLPNTREVPVPGMHYIQEDSPDEIGQAVADLVRELDRG